MHGFFHFWFARRRSCPELGLGNADTTTYMSTITMISVQLPHSRRPTLGPALKVEQSGPCECAKKHKGMHVRTCTHVCVHAHVHASMHARLFELTAASVMRLYVSHCRSLQVCSSSVHPHALALALDVLRRGTRTQ